MTGKELANYDKAWADQAAQYADDEQLTGGSLLTMRGGVLRFGEEDMPGNQACVIVLDAVRENTFYSAKFDPDAAATPICYAFGRGPADDMAPHESMQKDLTYFEPQAESCAVCPHNEWGSSDTGKGKACQNRRRLALIPAGYYAPKRGSRDFELELFDDPKHYQQAEIAYMKLPVLSVKEWSKYVNQVSATMSRPPYGVITRLSVVPDPKAQFKTVFEVIEEVPDELAAIIMARNEEAKKNIIQGYMPPREPEAPQGSIKGLRKTRR